MSILKYKYKAHRLVNTLFYLILFLIGFVLGFTVQKIDLNKLINQFLMIDSVNAYSLGEYDDYVFDEEFILESFNYVAEEHNVEFDIETYSYIICDYIVEYGYSSNPALNCYAFNKNDVYNISIVSSTNGSYNMITNNAVEYFRFFFYPKSSSYDTLFFGIQSSGSTSYIFFNTETYATNYDKLNENDTFKYNNVLDFSEIGIDLQFNENLFKDNPDFKEVCVNNYDTFSITSNQIKDYDDNNNPTFHDFDFIWFPHGMAYLSVWMYDSSNPTHVHFYGQDKNELVGWGYWLDTKEEIDNHFSNDNPGLYLELKGYQDKYSYYNWTLYPFEMTFTSDYYFYPVFSFNNSYLKQAGISTEVDNAYIKYLDGTIKEDSEKYCFYIKNEYDVNILTKNATGDFSSSITILGGTNKEDITYELELNKNPTGFFSTVNSFISKINPTINFINAHILELYTSMPLIVRMFILSFLTLIVVRILIGMVVR